VSPELQPPLPLDGDIENQKFGSSNNGFPPSASRSVASEFPRKLLGKGP
jgi:hypothetical protein